MLTPVICAICEKVIQEYITPDNPVPEKIGATSLISIFHKLYLGFASSTASGDAVHLPPQAIIPRDWALYSEWDAEPGDENREYFLNMQILYPDQKPFGSVTRVRVNIEPNRRPLVVVRSNAFPIGQEGTYTVRIWIEGDQHNGEPINLKIELVVLKGVQHDAQTPVKA